MRHLYIFLLLIGPIMILPAQDIVKAEYFINMDQGIGENIPIELDNNSVSNSVVFSFNADLHDFESGMHKLYCRVADENSVWSLSSESVFYILEPMPSDKIVEAEYYVNVDPGFGNASAISFSNAGSNVIASPVVQLNSLNEGIHTLYVRAKDENGKWSSIAKQSFYIIDNEEIVKIDQLEYYYSDGNSNSQTYIFDDFEPSFVVEFSENDLLANVSTLEYEKTYTLFVRALNSNGNYSPYSTVSFTFKELVATSIETAINEHQPSIYPNPVKDVVNIQNFEVLMKTDPSYAVYDLSGRTILKGSLLSSQLNLSEMASGTYYLVLISGEEIYGNKFIKE